MPSLVEARLGAQVPGASDPPKYVLPPQHIVDAFDSRRLHHSILFSGQDLLILPISTVGDL
ncbi:MAG: hypothetical protein HY047_19735 [Acidobacteria bacterium]|nr:hypothetical protein [Acidobacteriota bacterium]